MNLSRPLAVPDWQRNAGKRLGICLAIAFVIVAAGLNFLRLPAAVDPLPLRELVVELFEREVAKPKGEPDRLPAVEPTVESPPVLAPDSPVPEPSAPTDWQALKDAAVTRVLQESARTVSLHPQLDEKRRLAAVKYRPSRAPAKKEIWDNVEKDQFGRTLLWHENCYRVLDDPSAVNREIFETFTQYMVFCIGGEEWLIEFEQIDERYDYLAELNPSLSR